MKYNPLLFDKMPVIGIMRNFPNKVIDQIVPKYKKAGFTTLEITMNSNNVFKTIKRLSKENPDMNIGAGSVCNMNDLETVLEAGASFIVTPVFNEEVMSCCKSNDIPIFPGAFTPLEIYNAWEAGATAVKIFPANQLGFGYVRDVLAPLNDIQLLPTGGVTIDNIQEFFNAGSVGVGMGGSLFNKHLIASNDYNGLYQHFLELADKVNNRAVKVQS